MIKHTSLRCLFPLLSVFGFAFPALAQGGGGDVTIPRIDQPRKKPSEDRSKPATAIIDLRPKLKVGETISLTLESSSSSNAPAGMLGQPADEDDAKPAKTRSPASKATPDATNEMKTTLGITMKVQSIDEQGNATVDLVYDRVAINSKSPAGEFTFDSTKPAPKKTGDPLRDMSDPIETALRPLVGSHQTVTFDKNGNITKAEGGDAFSSLFALAGGGSGTGGGSLLGPISTKKSTTGQAAVGERWSTEDSLPIGPFGATTVRTGYQLVSATGSKANVSFEGRLSPNSAQASDSGFTLRECSHRGSYVWNTEVGFLDSMQDEQTTTMEIKSGDKTAEVRSKQITKVTRTK